MNCAIPFSVILMLALISLGCTRDITVLVLDDERYPCPLAHVYEGGMLYNKPIPTNAYGIARFKVVTRSGIAPIVARFRSNELGIVENVKNNDLFVFNFADSSCYSVHSDGSQSKVIITDKNYFPDPNKY